MADIEREWIAADNSTWATLAEEAWFTVAAYAVLAILVLVFHRDLPDRISSSAIYFGFVAGAHIVKNEAPLRRKIGQSLATFGVAAVLLAASLEDLSLVNRMQDDIPKLGSLDRLFTRNLAILSQDKASAAAAFLSLDSIGYARTTVVFTLQREIKSALRSLDTSSSDDRRIYIRLYKLSDALQLRVMQDSTIHALRNIVADKGDRFPTSVADSMIASAAVTMYHLDSAIKASRTVFKSLSQ